MGKVGRYWYWGRELKSFLKFIISIIDLNPFVDKIKLIADKFNSLSKGRKSVLFFSADQNFAVGKSERRKIFRNTLNQTFYCNYNSRNSQPPSIRA